MTTSQYPSSIPSNSFTRPPLSLSLGVNFMLIPLGNLEILLSTFKHHIISKVTENTDRTIKQQQARCKAGANHTDIK